MTDAGSAGGPAAPRPPRRAAPSGPPEPRASAAALWVRRRLVEGLRRLRPAGELHRSRVKALGLVAGLLATALMMVRLFVPSTVGMADTGARSSAALRPRARQLPGPTTTRRSRASSTPVGTRPPGSVRRARPRPTSRRSRCTSRSCGRAAAHRTARWCRRIRHPRVRHDRLGAVRCILIGLLVVFLPGSGPFRLAVAAGVALVMADGVFADFFVSAFADGTVLLAVLASIVALLVFWRSLTATTGALVLATILACTAVTVSPLMLAMVPAFLVALLHQRRPAAPRRRASPEPPVWAVRASSRGRSRCAPRRCWQPCSSRRSR